MTEGDCPQCPSSKFLRLVISPTKPEGKCDYCDLGIGAGARITHSCEDCSFDVCSLRKQVRVLGIPPTRTVEAAGSPSVGRRQNVRFADANHQQLAHQQRLQRPMQQLTPSPRPGRPVELRGRSSRLGVALCRREDLVAAPDAHPPLATKEAAVRAALGAEEAALAAQEAALEARSPLVAQTKAKKRTKKRARMRTKMRKPAATTIVKKVAKPALARHAPPARHAKGSVQNPQGL